MNYKRHFFWSNVAGMVGIGIGGFVWFIDAAIRMFSTSVSKMPFDAIKWRMFAYPAICGALAWLIVRFPLMAKCERCGTKLRHRRQQTHVYICPRCGVTFDTCVRVADTSEQQTTQPTIEDYPSAPKSRDPEGRLRQVAGSGSGMSALLASLRQTLYPKSQTSLATWKIALGVLCSLAVLSTCVSVKGLVAHMLGFQVPVYVVWAITNAYLVIGVTWNLIDPEDETTACLKWWQKLLLIGLGVLSVTVSLLAPLYRKI